MKNEKIKNKQHNKIKLIIAVSIILLLLIILFANRNKMLKLNRIAGSEYNVTINKTTIDISKVITATPNEPILSAGMIPIKWNESEGLWEITTKDDPDWYDYANGKYANIMLSDGYYKSELQVGITFEQVSEKNIGVRIRDTQLGSIFTWVPRLMYKDSDIQYLKDTCMVEYEWTTPGCFTYAKHGINEFDLAFTGMWVSKQTDTLLAMSTKTDQMNTEENIYGLIKNERVSVLTEEERVVIEKLNEKCGNIKNETTLDNTVSGEYKQVIKILNTNKYAPITTSHNISLGTITLKTIYKQNNIQMVLDENGNILSTDASGNAARNIDIDIEQYTFYVIDTEGNIKKHALMYVPVGKPDLTGFNPNTTFFVTYDKEGNEESVTPIGEKSPKGWFDYENQIWANIVVRNNGDEAYFVWIPRYMYTLNQDTQRSNVKFVDIENKYTDPETGKVVSLNNTEYNLPEAFTWNGTALKGYWMSKYELGDTSTYKPEIKGGSGVIRVKNIIANLGSDYTYEMYLIKEGKRIVWNEETKEYLEGTDSVTLTGNYTFTNLAPGDYAVEIVLRDSTGKFIKAINQEVTVLEPAEPEAPDLTGFDTNTTFYVTYDKDGNETSVVPIGEEPPSNWYDYNNQIWANIVVRNNEKEAYFTWIPRYQYKLDSANQRSDIVFIPKSVTTPESGYQIPEAFTFNNTQLAGYWMSKYELGDGEALTLTATVAGGFDTIRISNIINKTSKTISTYEAYLIKDGKTVAGPVTVNDEYTFTELEYGTYTVHLVGKEETGNQVLGMTKQIVLQELETPTVVGFMVDTTYIVTYDSAGNADETQTLRSVLKDGANINSDGALVSGEVDLSKIAEGRTWYNYSKQIWPNIVTRNNGKEAYFVWIQRYEYMLDNTNQRSRVILIPKSKTTPDSGYQIPEAFTFNNTQLAGYWMSKYELGT